MNSLLLSDFLCNVVGPTQTEKTNLTAQWFYDDTTGGSQCDRFLERLGLAVCEIDEALSLLVKGTALAGITPDQLRRRSMDQLKNCRLAGWGATAICCLKSSRQSLIAHT